MLVSTRNGNGFFVCACTVPSTWWISVPWQGKFICSKYTRNVTDTIIDKEWKKILYSMFTRYYFGL